MENFTKEVASEDILDKYKTKEYKKKRKAYFKMLKAHKKALIKSAKNAAKDPFDWEPGMEMLHEFLLFMKDYYTLGYNVLGLEADDRMSRLDGITKALEEYRLGYDVDSCLLDKYFNYDGEPQFLHEPTTVVINGKKCECNSVKQMNEDWGSPRDKTKDYQTVFKEYEDEMELHQRNFFELLIKEMPCWWD